MPASTRIRPRRAPAVTGKAAAKGAAEAAETKVVAAEEEEKHLMVERYRTNFCRSWERGKPCPYGLKCMFAHGEEELRTTEQNVADGLVDEEAVRKHQRKLKAEAARKEVAARRAKREKSAAKKAKPAAAGAPKPPKTSAARQAAGSGGLQAEERPAGHADDGADAQPLGYSPPHAHNPYMPLVLHESEPAAAEPPLVTEEPMVGHGDGFACSCPACAGYGVYGAEYDHRYDPYGYGAYGSPAAMAKPAQMYGAAMTPAWSVEMP